MILLQCPICRNYMAADAKEVMASETILCPHCHRESDKEEVLNQKKETKTHEKFLKEIKSFVNEIDTIDVNDKIGQLYRNYRISPIISTYFVNCLLENCHTEDFPPLFAKLEEPENVHLSSYIEELDRQISQTHDSLPEISMLAHTSGAKELAYQKKIKNLEQGLGELTNQLNSAQCQIETLNDQLDIKQKEIIELKDTIFFLKASN